MLIPVSNAFVGNDANGANGMKASIISLTLSLVLYSVLIPLMTVIKSNYNNLYHNQLVYLTVYQIFDQTYAVISLILMSALAIIQAMCFFQLSLEQACILGDQFERKSMTKFV